MVTAYIPAPSLQDRVDAAGPLGTAKVAELGAPSRRAHRHPRLRTGVTAAASSFSRDGTVLAGYSVAGDAVAWLMQVSTMKVIAGTQIGLAADVARLAVDLSADGGTLMAAYTSKRAQAGRVLLYRDRTGLAATVSRINSMGMSADRPWD